MQPPVEDGTTSPTSEDGCVVLMDDLVDKSDTKLVAIKPPANWKGASAKVGAITVHG